MKPQRSFSDTDATTSDESSRASSSFASSPTSNYIECEDVPTSSNYKKSDVLNGSEVIVVGPPSSNRLDEIFERAQQLLQREQAPEYKVENYFLRNHSSLDPIHRSTMMDWAYEVLEFSFPSPPQQSTYQLHPLANKTASRRKRKHSIEALHLVHATFSYIDRISTLNDPDPDQFKLLSMVCLHIAAKTSGLFGNSGHEASWPMRLRHDADRIEQLQSYYNPCQSQDFSLPSTPAPCRSSLVSDNASDDEREDVSGQTILSTPTSSSSAASSLSGLADALHCKPRPSMKMLSLSALCSLFGGYVHLDEMVNVEWTVLQHGLQWKVTGVTLFDWLNVYLDLAKLCLPQAWSNFFVDWHIVEEQALAQLEFAIEHPSFMTHPPSLISFAAFLNAIEDYNEDFLPGMMLLDRKMFEVMLCIDNDVVHGIRCALLEPEVNVN